MRELCDEALWLKAGRLMDYSAADAVVRNYVAEMDAAMQRRIEVEGEIQQTVPTIRPTIRTSQGAQLILNENRFGSLELEITAVQLLDEGGQPVTELVSGRSVCVVIDYLASQRIIAPIFQVHIYREDGLVGYDMHTETTALKVSTVQGEGQVVLHLERLDLNSGCFYVDVGCYAQDWAYAYDYHSNVYPLIMHGDSAKEAALNTPHRWQGRGGQVTQTDLPALKDS